jgi:hypothetical protein
MLNAGLPTSFTKEDIDLLGINLTATADHTYAVQEAANQ